MALLQSENVGDDDDDLFNLKALQKRRKQKSGMNEGFQGDAGGWGNEILPLQPPFQPGSTPQQGQNPSFLQCCSLGSIITQKANAVDSNVQIEIFGAGPQQTKKILDHYNFTLASLGESGGLFYAPYRKEETNEQGVRIPARQSVLFFKSLQQWAGGSDWTITCSDAVIGAAVGYSFVCLATNSQNIRVLSPSGQQKITFSIPGKFVCIAGGSHRFAVCFHSSLPIAVNIIQQRNEKGEDPDQQYNSKAAIQSLEYIIYSPEEVDRGSRKGKIPISTGTELIWFGFSDGGSLTTCDSAGIVRMLVEQWGEVWVEICDLKDYSNSQDTMLWIYGVREKDKGEILCLNCARKLGYPYTSARSQPQIIPFQLNFIDINAGISGGEQDSVPISQIEADVAVKEMRLAINSENRAREFRNRAGVNKMNDRWWRFDPLNAQLIGATTQLPGDKSSQQQSVQQSAKAMTLKEIRNLEASLDMDYVKLNGFALSTLKPSRAYEISTSVFNKNTTNVLRTLAYRAKNAAVQERIELLSRIRFPEKQKQDKNEKVEEIDCLRALPLNRIGYTDPESLTITLAATGGVLPTASKQLLPSQSSSSSSFLTPTIPIIPNLDQAIGGLGDGSQRLDLLYSKFEQMEKTIQEQSQTIDKLQHTVDSQKNDMIMLRTQTNAALTKVKNFKQPTLGEQSSAQSNYDILPSQSSQSKQSGVGRGKKGKKSGMEKDADGTLNSSSIQSVINPLNMAPPQIKDPFQHDPNDAPQGSLAQAKKKKNVNTSSTSSQPAPKTKSKTKAKSKANAKQNANTNQIENVEIGADSIIERQNVQEGEGQIEQEQIKDKDNQDEEDKNKFPNSLLSINNPQEVFKAIPKTSSFTSSSSSSSSSSGSSQEKSQSLSLESPQLISAEEAEEAMRRGAEFINTVLIDPIYDDKGNAILSTSNYDKKKEDEKKEMEKDKDGEDDSIQLLDITSEVKQVERIEEEIVNNNEIVKDIEIKNEVTATPTKQKISPQTNKNPAQSVAQDQIKEKPKPKTGSNVSKGQITLDQFKPQKMKNPFSMKK
ncbi:MAG: putative WD repeat and HMG-box DNA-binding protein 1 [Streblomastix strix]|uniref:Putative WD repeat and HMG-box DNA-binding protein 1 n=1 Tax=Streblomastix strix TaxID=222440 RepID=A0A5J4VMC8_9EUKA|nr:MAG: putative WD repeat and HMG-box DNA-binding protein 1 [Streblomastix strix]